MQRILLIDDEEQFCWMMKSMIEEIGCYQVIIATNGTAGLKTARKVVPDLILLDVEMPGMKGHEVLRKLNKLRKTRQIPVIMVTGIDTDESITEATFDFAEQYIVKPVDLHSLRRAIERALVYNYA